MIEWNQYFPQDYGVDSDGNSSKIYTFDTETTSYYSKDSLKWEHLEPNADITDYPYKMGLVYLWTFSIDDEVYFGRELKDFVMFLNRLNALNPYKKIIYVHNLGYDFQFLRNVLRFDEVFSRMPHKPIYARVNQFNIEFRCSYMLTNMSLEKSAKEYGNRPKLVGALDYNKARTPLTPLTQLELAYAEHDNLSLYDVIAYFRKQYNTLEKICLTSTGRVRLPTKQRLYAHDFDYGRRIKRMYPDIEHYKRLCVTLIGGYTSANYLYTSSENDFDLVRGVVSLDRASSYPHVMVTCKFPCSSFEDVKDFNEFYKKQNRRYYCYYGKISLSNFRARIATCYISDSKCYNKVRCTTNNGRVVCGEYLEMFITDVDFDIISRNYEGEIKFLSLYRARKQYLPKPFIEYVLELYGNKTSLKGVEEKTDLYNLSKSFINAMYGMMCTNTVRDDVIFDNDENWRVNNLTDSQIKEKLAKQRPFLNFAWGVWVLAYARYELWRLIFLVGNDNVYNDTDSGKIVNYGLHKAAIADLNNDILKGLHKAADDLNLPFEKFSPCDPKGKSHPMGLWEIDAIYKTFATYGAKNYAYTLPNDKFSFVISGMAKKYRIKPPTEDDDGLRPTMKSMNEYRIGNKFPSARKTFSYIDNQPTGIKVYDFLGNEYISNYKYGIAMIDTTFTIGQSLDHAKFLASIQQTVRNKYSNPISQILRGIDDL